MGLAGILLGLALLVWLAYRGWSILLLAPAAALVAAAFAGEPLLAHWTQTFMGSAAQFLAHIPILTKARDAYQRAMGVSAQLRHVLDKGDETLKLLMGQMEQAANIRFVAASEVKKPEPVKVETTTANGDKADAARA